MAELSSIHVLYSNSVFNLTAYIVITLTTMPMGNIILVSVAECKLTTEELQHGTQTGLVWRMRNGNQTNNLA